MWEIWKKKMIVIVYKLGNFGFKFKGEIEMHSGKLRDGKFVNLGKKRVITNWWIIRRRVTPKRWGNFGQSSDENHHSLPESLFSLSHNRFNSSFCSSQRNSDSILKIRTIGVLCFEKINVKNAKTEWVREPENIRAWWTAKKELSDSAVQKPEVSWKKFKSNLNIVVFSEMAGFHTLYNDNFGSRIKRSSFHVYNNFCWFKSFDS